MFLASAFRQAWPAKPGFTEADIPDLSGRVYLVTGANTGVGRLVAQALYARNATVWVGARSEDKAAAAMAGMREACPGSRGRLVFLHLDLADLAAVRKAADRFLASSSADGEVVEEEEEEEEEGGKKEEEGKKGGEGKGREKKKKKQSANRRRLDVLFNNAGVMIPPAGSKTAQGYELQLGTNCLGHFLLTKLLTPVLVETAAARRREEVEEETEAGGGGGGGGGGNSRSRSSNGDSSVRVVWVSSSAAELLTVGDGIPFDNLDDHRFRPYPLKYGTSKVGDYYYATEYGRRHESDGIVSVSLNPGNIRTELDRHTNCIEYMGRMASTWPAINGAYTELYAGLSSDITVEKFARTGKWVIPWGIVSDIKPSVQTASKPESEGGTGVAQRFWEWSEEQVKPYI